MPSFPPKVVHLHFYPPVPVILRSGTDSNISFKWTWSIKTDIWNMNLYFNSCLYPDWRHWCSPAKPKMDHLPEVTCQTNAPCSLHATMLSIPLRKDEDMPQGFSLQRHPGGGLPLAIPTSLSDFRRKVPHIIAKHLTQHKLQKGMGGKTNLYLYFLLSNRDLTECSS